MTRRDMLSRVIYGNRISFVVGFSSITPTTIAILMVVGVAMGLVAGYYGGLIEAILMRIVDGLLSFTPLVLAIVFMVALGFGLQNGIFALAVTFIGMFARVTRGDTLNLKGEPFVEAAPLLGGSHLPVVPPHTLST